MPRRADPDRISLHLWKRPDSASWWIRGTLRGRPYARSTGVDCEEQAREILADLQARSFRERVYGKKSVATFAQAVTAHLRDAPRSQRDVQRIEKLLDHFADTPLRDIGQHSLEGAYKACLRDGEATGAGGKLRGVFAPLRAVLETGALHGLCERPKLKAPKVASAPTDYLKPHEVARLVAAAPPHAKALFVFLFATGARASEAIDLEWADVDLRGARATLRQKQGTIRDADLPPVALAALAALPHREGAVFRPGKRGGRGPKPAGGWQGYRRTRGTGEKSEGEGGQFKKLWAAACHKAGLPGRWREWTDKRGKRRQFAPNIGPHGARHTWATYHYAIHSDLLGLRDAGGWSTTQMVERYAKRLPDAYRGDAARWLAGELAAAAPLAPDDADDG